MPRQSGMSDEDDNHMSQGSEDIPMDDINEDSPNVDGPTSSNHSIHITVDESTGTIYLMNRGDRDVPNSELRLLREALVSRYGRAGRALLRNMENTVDSDSDDEENDPDYEQSSDNSATEAEDNDEEYEDEEEEEAMDDDDPDDDFVLFGALFGRRRQTTRKRKIFKNCRKPCKAGAELLKSGEFGRPPGHFEANIRKLNRSPPCINSMLRNRELGMDLRAFKSDISPLTLPNSSGVEVARYGRNAYSGQFSKDGSFFYTCAQDFKVRLYDTTKPLDLWKRAPARRSAIEDRSSEYSLLPTLKTITAHEHYAAWTITDANLSPDNKYLIYSAIRPTVSLVKTAESDADSEDNDVISLDFSEEDEQWSFGIWSIRFSADSKEIVAGATRGYIMVYDVNGQRLVFKIKAHSDDVNAVCFADDASSNILVSGSDDSFLKVWDRRSLSANKPSGVLMGHTEGITYVSAKGDGRYCISNGKDQTCKLWDLRKMYSMSEFEGKTPKYCGVHGFDYRGSLYNKPRFRKHPHDCSVMTYTGHTVMRTLIRAHFSPEATTGQQYIYSGSADGRIHIWNLDGMIARVIDRKHTLPIFNRSMGIANNPSAADRPSRHPSMQSCVVRDVAWHPTLPIIMSTAWGASSGWLGDSGEGNVALHEWKGYGKSRETVEDAAARDEWESFDIHRDVVDVYE